MKIAVLVSIARQVEGEMVYCQVIKAHTNPDELKQYLDSSDLPKTSDFSGMQCVFEYGVFKDIEVEGMDGNV